MRFYNVKVILIIITVISLYLLFDFVENDNELLLVLLLIYFTNCIAFICGIRYMKFYKFPVGVVFPVINVLYFCYSIVFVPFDEFQCGIFNYKILWYILISNIIFYIVYFTLLESQKSSVALPTKKKYRLDVLFFVAICCFLGSLVTWPISDFENTLRYLSISLLISLYLSKKSNWVVIVVFLGILSYTFVQAIMTTLVLTIVYLMLFCLVNIFLTQQNSKGRIILLYCILGVGSFFVFLYSAQKMEIRNNLWSENISAKEKISINEIIQKVSENKDITSVQGSFWWRLSYSASAISTVYENTPSSVPYWNGDTYWPIVTKFIPRFLWANKPKESMGQRFGHAYGLIADDNLTTSMNTPILAEGYMNYGIGGVVIISIVMAFGGALSFISINKGKLLETIDPFEKFVLAAFVVYFIQWESNLSMFIGKVVILSFIRLILIKSLKNI
jgi:hypothetical protein